MSDGKDVELHRSITPASVAGAPKPGALMSESVHAVEALQGAVSGPGAVMRMLDASRDHPSQGQLRAPSAVAAELEKIDGLVEKLMADKDPTLLVDQEKLRIPPVPSFYAPGVLGKIDRRFASVLTNGSPLYLQEESESGTTMLTLDYTRAYNKRAEDQGQPNRMLYVRVAPLTTTPARFLSAFGTKAGAPFSIATLRNRGFDEIIGAIVAAMRQHRVRAVVIDHAHNLGFKLRVLLGEMLLECNPVRSHAPLDTCEYADDLVYPVGLIIVSNLAPHRLFEASPHVLQLLGGCHEILRCYTELEDVAEAMRQACFGLEDFTLESPEDALMADWVQFQSQGKPENMRAIFGHLGAFATKLGRRPDIEMLRSVSRYYQPLDRNARQRQANASGPALPTSGPGEESSCRGVEDRLLGPPPDETLPVDPVHAAARKRSGGSKTQSQRPKKLSRADEISERASSRAQNREVVHRIVRSKRPRVG